MSLQLELFGSTKTPLEILQLQLDPSEITKTLKTL